MENPYTPSQEPALEPQTGVRSLFWFSSASLLFVLGDSLGLPIYLFRDPYGLFAIMVPLNLLGFIVYVYALMKERAPRWQFLLLLGLIVNTMSLALVGVLVLYQILIREFPGPG